MSHKLQRLLHFCHRTLHKKNSTMIPIVDQIRSIHVPGIHSHLGQRHGEASRGSQRKMDSKKSVLIVGGGVAGLACGVKLASSVGFEVTLLEAADRIGGRVNSSQFGENQHVELGAQWVHGEQGNSIFSLVKKFNILEDDRVSPKFGLTAMFVTQRGEFLAEGVKGKVLEVMDKLQVAEASVLDFKDNEPLGNFAARTFWKYNKESPIHVSEKICTGILDWLHRFQNSIDGAESWFVTSCKGQMDYISCEGNPTVAWKRPATYATLLQILLHGSPNSDRNSNLPTWIHLNKEVTSMEYADGEKTVVHCKDGSMYTADYVVCTVSLGVLKRKHATLFQPALSPQKVNSIQHLGFGVVDKIFLEFGCSWWPENSLGFNLIWDDCAKVNDNWLPDASHSILAKEDPNGIPMWCRSLLGFYTLEDNPKTLFTWVTGPPAEFMESLDTETLEAHLLKVLRTFVGGVINVPNPTRILRSTWRSNVHTRGSYSFRTMQSEEKGASAKTLGEPIVDDQNKPVICFAGEATHPGFYSTVHGAYETGLREADRITTHAQLEVSTSSSKVTGAEEEEPASGSGGAGFCCSLLDCI